MTATLKPIELGPFKQGMNNRRPDFRLRVPREGTFLRSAVNADITTEGTLQRRPGYAEEVPGEDVHSLWSDDLAAYCIDYDELLSLRSVGGVLQKTVVLSGLTPGRFGSFCREPGGDVLFSNGVVFKRLGSTVQDFGTPLLQTQPLLAATTPGSLTPGFYQLSFAYVDDAGELGGASQPVQVELTTTGAIAITLLPASWPDGVAGLIVYMTPVNGDALYRAAVLAAPTTSLTISVTPQLGARCETLGMTPLPPGDIVRWHNGRLFVAQGAMLHYSEPYALGRYNPFRNYLLFAKPITVLEPCTNGIYIVADQTYWLPGDVSQAELQTALPYGGVFGSGGQTPDRNACYWMSERGMVLGSQSGEVTNLQDENVAVEKAQVAGTLYRERDGIKQMLASLFGTERNQLQASSFMEAEIVRKGTDL